MKLIVDNEDLKSEHRDEHLHKVRFSMFTPEVQAVIRAAGRATYQPHMGTPGVYAAIIAPLEPPAPLASSADGEGSSGLEWGGLWEVEYQEDTISASDGERNECVVSFLTRRIYVVTDGKLDVPDAHAAITDVGLSRAYVAVNSIRRVKSLPPDSGADCVADHRREILDVVDGRIQEVRGFERDS